MKRVMFCALASMLLLLTGNLHSQSFSLDSVTGLHGPDTVLVNQPISFFIRMAGSDTTSFDGITNGFRIYSPDGVTWSGTSGDTLPVGLSSFFDLTFTITLESVDGAGADTVGFGGAKLFGTGLPIGFDDVAYRINIGPIDAQYHKDEICIDSSFYPPTGAWKWAGPIAFPDWDGPHCFTIFDPSAPTDPSNIVLSEDSLYFTTTEGGVNPANQTFDILTDQDPFDFTIDESISWLILSPILGTTPQTITASINNFGLSAGVYIDSAAVTSGDADNSPQWVTFVLEITPPPAIIDVSDSEFFFNAVAGGSNPADKILSISNVGGNDLNWSVSNSQGWLSLSPTSGTNDGDVTLSVDVTGLGFDDYVDTIVVTDPAASNDPVYVIVNLSVGSDLPLIEVDSAFNFIIVPEGILFPPSRDIIIRNGGAGTMNYTLTENSANIFSLNPISGTADDTVTVGFKVSGFSIGNDIIDTLWVESNEAINSPFPVVFHFHFVEIPAQIQVSTDTVQLNVFECTQGANAIPPQVFFTIDNVAGGEAYMYTMEYDTDLFLIETEFNAVPEFVSVVANKFDLPAGVYYDTITISAQNAINSPKRVIVKYNVNSGLQSPEVLLTSTSYIIPTKENEGPIPGSVLGVDNRFGGCMEWYLDNAVPWIYPDIDSGNVPEVIGFNVNASGFTFGEYPDSFYVTAPGATNSPKKVNLLLRVWKYTGDFNYDANLNIADLVAMVSYFFGSGPGPEPEWRVSDLNCDHEVNIADLVYFVDYSFNNGPIPCGNPFK